MIVSFSDREAAKLFRGQRSLRLPPEIQTRARVLMIRLNEARLLNDLMVPPGNGFHALVGDRKGQYAVKINKQWRICFRWRDGGAYDVEITDYH